MRTIFLVAWKVLIFILKIICKTALVLGALALCSAKIFLMLLILVGQIALCFVRLCESV